MLASVSFPERALQSLIRFELWLWFHVESDLSKASGVNASEMEQTLKTAGRGEAALHYTTRFWQAKASRSGIRAALVTWQPDLRPWGRAPEFRVDCISWVLQADWILLKLETEMTKPGQRLHLLGDKETLQGSWCPLQHDSRPGDI